jgi:hypothetical protein
MIVKFYHFITLSFYHLNSFQNLSKEVNIIYIIYIIYNIYNIEFFFYLLQSPLCKMQIKNDKW